MKVLFIANDNSLSYGTLIVSNLNEKISENSEFYLKENGIKTSFCVRNAKSILFKIPDNQGFYVWFKNKIIYLTHTDLIETWNLLTHITEVVKSGI